MNDESKLALWYVGATLFFVALLCAGYVVISAFGISVGTQGVAKGFGTLYYLSYFDIFILSLATFRAVRLLTQDKIFQFVRDIFLDLDHTGSRVKPRAGFRRTCAELIECPWCTGLWAALISIGLYLIHPFGRLIVIIFAVAGLGAMFNSIVGSLMRIGDK